jgi:N-methylhydantoinase A
MPPNSSSDAAGSDRIGADVAGTFTDLVLHEAGTGRISIGKVLTTPSAPSDAVLAGATELLARCGREYRHLDLFVHATTLVANALIERAGARTALVVNTGFVDVLDFATENRYDLFDLFIARPDPLVPRRLRFGIHERTAADGTVLSPVDPTEVGLVAKELQRDGIGAVGVCLLHSYRNPGSERRVRDLLCAALPDLAITISAELVPEIREYPRTSTVAANAYVQPMVQRYLEALEGALREKGLRRPPFIMLSEGGFASIATAAAAPVRMVESGPAAGAVAAAATARRLGAERVMSFDMGGTTAKLCMILDGAPKRAATTEAARLHRFKRGSGIPLSIPAIELIEIGAGGGSIAQVERSGLLRVGPRSAGARPGPACYGLGATEPTVTDADLALGYLSAEGLLGGRMPLDRAAAQRALQEAIGDRLGFDAERSALAVHELVNNNMAIAARTHAVEHGYDPRQFSLLAFGGAGPLHAWHVAKLLKMPRLIVPPSAGVMSALGLLLATPSIELSRSQVDKIDRVDFKAVESLLAEMRRDATAILAATGIRERELRVTSSVDCRYSGQAHEVRVPLADATGLDAAALLQRFEAVYERLYGRLMPGGVAEIITWRVEVRGAAKPIGLSALRDGGGSMRGSDERDALFPGCGKVRTRVVTRDRLAIGERIAGPALIVEDETTTVAGPGSVILVDDQENLIVEIS